MLPFMVSEEKKLFIHILMFKMQDDLPLSYSCPLNIKKSNPSAEERTAGYLILD